MKFVGRADGPHTIICRLFDDDLVADVAEATEFYLPTFRSSSRPRLGWPPVPDHAPRSPRCQRFARSGLGGGARRGRRPAAVLGRPCRCAGRRLRVRRVQRSVRTRASDAFAAVDSRQECRSERPHLADRHRRRGGRPRRRTPPGVQGQRRGDAGREHRRHDPPGRRHPGVRQRGAHAGSR